MAEKRKLSVRMSHEEAWAMVRDAHDEEFTPPVQLVERAILVVAELAKSALIPRCGWLLAALHTPEEPRCRMHGSLPGTASWP